MGSLANQYISQSYTSLIHLGSDTTISSSYTDLQDGLGNSLKISVNAQGDISASGNIFAANLTASASDISALNAFTASVAGTNAFTASIKNTNVFTASLAGTNTFTASIAGTNVFTASIAGTNAFTQSANSRLTALETTSASVNVSISALNGFTASVAGTNNFTASIAGTNTFTASIAGTNAFTASIAGTNTFTASIAGTNAFTQSANARLNSIEAQSGSWVTSAVTASSLVTASFSGNTLTFTKGDASTFGVVIPDVSGSTINTGSFATTASFNAYTQSNDQRVTSLEVNSASVNTSVTNLNSATASLFTSASLGLTTASFAGNTLTFTKGNGTTFGVTIPDVSGSVTDISALNAFTASIAGTNTFTQSAAVSIAALNAATSSYVTSAITASSLVTASFSGNTLTFTKGNGTTFGVLLPDVSGSTIDTGSFVTTSSFNAFTQSYQIDSSSFDSRINGIVTGTGFATTGSNTFNGNQTITTAGNTQLNIISTDPSGQANLDFQAPNANFRAYGDFRINNNGQYGGSGSVQMIVRNNNMVLAADQGFQLGQTNAIGNGIGAGAVTINVPTGSEQLQLTGSLVVSNTLTASLAEGFTYVGDVSGRTIAVSTSSFASTINTGSFATTGSNTFTGEQTLVDAAGNSVTLADVSGSLVLVAKTFTSSSAALSHISSSSNSFVNLIFKNNNNAGTTIVSGSNNIWTNAAAATAGFNRYIGGSQNYYGFVPQLTGSAAFSPSMSNNIVVTGMVLRIPVSSSAYTFSGNILSNSTANGIQLGTAVGTPFTQAVSGLTMTNNNINGSITATAYKTPLSASVAIQNSNIGGTATLNMDSSSIQLAGMVQQGQLTINNSYFPSALSASNAAIGTSAILSIGGNTIFASGSNATFPSNRTIINSAMIGGSNVISASLNGNNAQIHSTILLGQSLIALGTNTIPAGATAADWGSVYVGRWNAIDGTKDQTAETIFAVGTGTGTAARKTGFLIDSGSNTFVEGSLNVSGSTTITGSLILSSSATTELTVIGNSEFTGSLSIQSGSAFFVNGNKQFNVGAFQSNVTQSGSANVSQSMNFEVTDISSGVSIVSNSRITLANSGTYNIQFSTQAIATGGADNLYIWLKKNGTNVTASAGNVEIQNNAEIIAAWNYVVDAAAGDYFELAWQAGNADTILLAANASGNIPSIPSIILTVTQVR
jgi:hypothetical protein